MKPRVALLTNIPTPYRLSFYRKLHRRVDLHVIFDDRSEPNRQWNLRPGDLDFPHAFSRGIRLRHVRKRPDLAMNDDRYVHLKLDVLPQLFRLRPDAVISGEFGARSLQAMLYGWLTRTPVIYWSEVTRHTETRTSRLKTALRRLLVKGAGGFWSNGLESTQLLVEYGAAPETIQPGMTGVDTRFFAEETRRWLPERDRLRAELGVTGTTFLFVGQFIERKGLKHYLEALDMLAAEAPRGWSVVFAGSGPLEPALQEWRALHPEIPVILTGFLQSEALPRLYALSDVFVMPTLEDNWSLVALEAAVAGLPQVFSRYNGCASDLLANGLAGCVVDPLRTSQFTAALRVYVDTPPRRLPDSLCERFMEFYGPEQVAERAFDSVQAVLQPPARPIAAPQGALR
jgi:glycosyltransferase involved in cell wall biosynthesis